MLPGLGVYGANCASAGISPSGQFLAYAQVTLTILHLQARATTDQTQQVGALYDLFWSHDGSHLALDNREWGFWVVSMTDGRPVSLAGTPGQSAASIIGWIDASHLAVTLHSAGPYYTDPNGDTFALSARFGSLDIATGQVKPIATVSSPGLGSPGFSISADGSEVLFYNGKFRDNPYIPLVEEINVASGKVTPLPNIAKTTGSGFTSLAWQPGTAILAVSTEYGVNGDLRDWLLDPRHDSAAHVMDGQYVEGWVPDGGPLVTSTGQQITQGFGPYTISTVSLLSSSQPRVTVLTKAAMTFPFLGFVRTA